jgi:hypothetical protein
MPGHTTLWQRDKMTTCDGSISSRWCWNRQSLLGFGLVCIRQVSQGLGPLHSEWWYFNQRLIVLYLF